MRGLILKLSLLFFSAMVLNTVLHELSHALMAFALHIRSTLFHLFVNPDFSHASVSQVVLVAGVGPVFSLVLGAMAWVAYRWRPDGTLGVFMLYCATVGVCIFLGNLFSTAMGGDFGTVAAITGASPSMRLAVSVAGLLLLVVFMFRIGGHFARLASCFSGGPVRTSLAITLIPALLGTVIRAAVYLPLPVNLLVGMFCENIFWTAAAAGAWKVRAASNRCGPDNRSSSAGKPLTVGWADLVLALVSILLVRAMLRGITFTPPPV